MSNMRIDKVGHGCNSRAESALRVKGLRNMHDLMEDDGAVIQFANAI